MKLSSQTSTSAFDKRNVGVQSECGKLDVALMHRPGKELLRLTEENLQDLLFDAIPDITITDKSHDIFSQYLRNHGVHVLYVTELLRETLNSSDRACHTLIDGILSHCFLKTDHQEEFLPALRQWLLNRTPHQLVDDVICGVARSQLELGTSNYAQIIFHQSDAHAEFIIPPLPNLIFTRDAFSIIENNVFIWNMAKPARQNEPLIFRVIFQYHPQLSTSALHIVEWQTTSSDQPRLTVEGGDVAYLGDGVLLIGCGERTNRPAIEALARTGIFRRVIAVMIPPQRDYMHLDTVLSSVGRHAFTLHGRLAHQMEVFTVETRDANNNAFAQPKWTSYGSDIRDSLRKVLNDDELVFYDAADEETSIAEQRDCRHNVLAIDECHVVTYAGGDTEKGVVAQMIRKNTCWAGLIPTQGLLEGGGGAHCMTNAIRRRAK